MNENRPTILIMSGLSGSGKSTVVTLLKERCRDCHFAVSCTTRPKRGDPNERYRFLSREEFEARIRDGYFWESAVYNGNYYGTPKEEIRGNRTVVEINTEGRRRLMETDLRKTHRMVSAFLMAPSAEELFQRLEDRRSKTGESLESIKSRLMTSVKELNDISLYDAVIVNYDKNETAAMFAHLLEGGATKGNAADIDIDTYQKELLRIAEGL